MSEAISRPTLRVVSGSPTPEELAVVSALVAAAGSGDERSPAPPAARGTWSDPARRMRRPWLPGPNAWRSAGS